MEMGHGGGEDSQNCALHGEIWLSNLAGMTNDSQKPADRPFLLADVMVDGHGGVAVAVVRPSAALVGGGGADFLCGGRGGRSSRRRFGRAAPTAGRWPRRKSWRTPPPRFKSWRNWPIKSAIPRSNGKRCRTARRRRRKRPATWRRTWRRKPGPSRSFCKRPTTPKRPICGWKRRNCDGAKANGWKSWCGCWTRCMGCSRRRMQSGQPGLASRFFLQNACRDISRRAGLGAGDAAGGGTVRCQAASASAGCGGGSERGDPGDSWRPATRIRGKWCGARWCDCRRPRPPAGARKTLPANQSHEVFPVQKLGKNIGGYRGKTVEIQRVLRESNGRGGK